MLRSSLLLFVLAGMASGISAQPDCSQTSTGHIPINDLGTGTYLGMTGGLYANGSNFRPPAHQAAGLAFAAQVQPLDASGTVSYTHLRAHETVLDLVCRLLLEKKKKNSNNSTIVHIKRTSETTRYRTD